MAKLRAFLRTLCLGIEAIVTLVVAVVTLSWLILGMVLFADYVARTL